VCDVLGENFSRIEIASDEGASAVGSEFIIDGGMSTL
jgi:hypothetical protein